jgi:subtilase family serine protease
MRTPNHKEKINLASNPCNSWMLWLSLAAVILLASSARPALAASGLTVAHNTPGYVFAAKSLGSEDAAKTIEVSIWLNPHNPGQLDALANQLYDRTSPHYRQFLTRSQFAARFAPTASEAKIVQQFFEQHNLHVVKIGPQNFFVRARGTVADVESAFQVHLNNYEVNGKTLRANDRDPHIDGAAAPLVRSVAGLDTGVYEHPLMTRPTSASGSKALAFKPAAASASAKSNASDFYTNNCFGGVVTQTFSNNNNGSFPIGTYTGNSLNEFTLTSPGCGYTPPEIQTAYNLTGLYKQGYNGAGQTIGIIDWCGSSTITSDANAFSAYFGLPALTASNFAITYIPSPSLCNGPEDAEINIDVEWAHAIAPGASINLIVPPSAEFQDIDQSEYIAIDDGLATVISGSYGAPEAFVFASELQNGNLINEVGAVLGISANFATGDYGDVSTVYGVKTVFYPADSPWATAVGGVSLALHPNNSIAWQAGWGTNEILLAEEGYVADPPLNFGLYGGSGGGTSTCAFQVDTTYSITCLAGFAKPVYQKALPGKYRQLPDVSWLADPFTGAVILMTIPGQLPSQVWQVYGGTSLATPMFSALWAIANEEAGAPLGLAASYLYSMPAGTIYDIVPQTSPTNVTASIQESTTTNKYSASELAGVTGSFIDGIWNIPYYDLDAYVFTFGTDTSLKTKPGWDNVTGVGTPNAKAFADYFKPAAAPKK